MPISPLYGETWPGPCTAAQEYLASITSVTLTASITFQQILTNYPSGGCTMTYNQSLTGTDTLTRTSLYTTLTHLHFHLYKYGCCSPCAVNLNTLTVNPDGSGTSSANNTCPAYHYLNFSTPISSSGIELGMDARLNPTTHICEIQFNYAQDCYTTATGGDIPFGTYGGGSTPWIPLSTLVGTHTITTNLDENGGLPEPFEGGTLTTTGNSTCTIVIS